MAWTVQQQNLYYESQALEPPTPHAEISVQIERRNSQAKTP